jgi:hypothetical protein
MRLYSVVVSDFEMYRHPQTQHEYELVEAEDVEDAIAIASVRMNFPLDVNRGDGYVHTRKLANVIAREIKP